MKRLTLKDLLAFLSSRSHWTLEHEDGRYSLTFKRSKEKIISKRRRKKTKPKPWKKVDPYATLTSCDSLQWDNYDTKGVKNASESTEFEFVKAASEEVRDSSNASTLDNRRAGLTILREMRELRADVKKMTDTSQFSAPQTTSSIATAESPSERDKRMKEYLSAMACGKELWDSGYGVEEQQVVSSSPTDSLEKDAHEVVQEQDAREAGTGEQITQEEDLNEADVGEQNEEEHVDHEPVEKEDVKLQVEDKVESEVLSESISLEPSPEGNPTERAPVDETTSEKAIVQIVSVDEDVKSDGKAKKKKRKGKCKRTEREASTKSPAVISSKNVSKEKIAIGFSFPPAFKKPSADPSISLLAAALGVKECDTSDVSLVSALRRLIAETSPEEGQEAGRRKASMELIYRDLFEWEAAFCEDEDRFRSLLAARQERNRAKAERTVGWRVGKEKVEENAKESVAHYKNPRCPIMTM